ncbi:MAG: DUF1080 domain-containing protein [Sediminicola sp.]|tara:strand:- start:37193 stop:37804 length:612 start_codon:yes stop_codon:yes gene_type:complete
MKTQFVLFFLLATLLPAHSQNASVNQEPAPLFDGKTFNGWKVPDNNQWWEIENGILVAKNDPEKQGSILWTTVDYNDFTVQLDFKFGEGDIDSGIFMRGESPTNAQIQIGVSGSLKRDMTGSPYVPEKGYPVEAENIGKLLKPTEWNTMKAKAIGNTYTVWLNGEQVMQYTLENADSRGPIGLQVHPGRDMEIFFRNIFVQTH